MTMLREGLRVLALLILCYRCSLAQAPGTPPPQPAGPPRGSSGPPEHAKVTPINNLPNPYETIRNLGTLPDNRRWGSVSAVHVDADGKHIWAGDRCGGNVCLDSNVDPMVKLDPNGKVVASFGAGQILWPHGMDVDKQGNIWVADARSATPAELAKFPDAKGKGHTVLKFSPQGKLLMTIGTGGEAGDPPAKLTEPNDVLVAPDGSIFIAESHNAQFLDQNPPNGIGRITKWSPDGKLIKTFGIVRLRREPVPRPAFAGDGFARPAVRRRSRQPPHPDLRSGGQAARQWFQFSRISGLYIDRNDTLYAIDSESDDNYNPGWRKGLRVGSARTGEVVVFRARARVEAAVRHGRRRLVR